MNDIVYDKRSCALGEGPLWHPLRKQLYWFDILGKRLLTVDAGRPRHWQFDEHVSAAGWIDHDRLLIASETGLFGFNLETGEQKPIINLEADNPVTRSNDGRADPWGGFWIGTMGKNAEPGAGAIYRYFKGAITRLFSDITISNSICFSPDRAFAYFTDTASEIIQRQPLDKDGWPSGTPETFVGLQDAKGHPDGSVVDAKGYLWNAQWGGSRVARYSPEGQEVHSIELPAIQISCPAFGGERLGTLFVTSARQGLKNPAADEGQTFAIDTAHIGQAEHQVAV